MHPRDRQKLVNLLVCDRSSTDLLLRYHLAYAWRRPMYVVESLLDFGEVHKTALQQYLSRAEPGHE